MRLFMICIGLLLAGCQSTGFFYEKSSGLRVDANPALLARFQDEKLQCDAESAKDALASRERDLMKHNQLIQLIYEACMARRGYIVRR
jgi:hypothetical protein